MYVSQEPETFGSPLLTHNTRHKSNKKEFKECAKTGGFCSAGHIQYSSQVTSRVHALRGMRAREKLVRVQGCFEELRAKPKSPESSTIANLPERLLLRVLAQSRNSLYIKFTSQNIVTCSYNISVPYTVCNCYERLVGGQKKKKKFTILSKVVKFQVQATLLGGIC